MNANNKQLVKEIFEDFESSPFFNLESYNINFDEVALDFLKLLLISSLIKRNEIEIGVFSDEKGNVGAQISYDIYNSDKMLNLRLVNMDLFEIELSYFDDKFNDGDYRVHSYKLSEEEFKGLPEGLINIMRDVLISNKPRTVRGSTLK